MQHIKDRIKLGAVLAAAILLISAILSLISCKKNSHECEKWLVLDYCKKRSNNVNCDVSGTQYERTICDEDLQLAHDGKEKVRLSDNDIILLTRYIHKI